jgi:tRNA threonylcarbamoyladenosine biosynthesis protein TsaE
MSLPGTHVWRTVSGSAEQTAAIGSVVGLLTRAGDLIALNGELGAGKTQFVRGLAQGMGIDPAVVASPTFVLVHEYTRPNIDDERPVLVHIDAYRVTSLADLESIGWDLGGDADPRNSEIRRGAVVVIEWAQRLEGSLGPDMLEVTLEHDGETRRRVSIRPYGKWIARMGTLRQTLDKMTGATH